MSRYKQANMKNIKYIKVRLGLITQERGIISFLKEFVFIKDISAFNTCETIEEVRDEFYNNLDTENNIVDNINIWLFSNKKNLLNNKFEEYLGE